MSDPVNAADAIVQAETMLGDEGYSRLQSYIENITMEIPRISRTAPSKRNCGADSCTSFMPSA